jgi:hypothetical protein
MGAGASVPRSEAEIGALISEWIRENAPASKIKSDLSELWLDISDDLSEKFALKFASLVGKDFHIHRAYSYMMYMLDMPAPVIEEKFLNDRPIRAASASVVGEGGGPYGVSLQYLFHFLDKYNISETMTTAEVVREIIIPETFDSKQTFLEAKLSSAYPYYCSDLRLHHRKYPPSSALVASFDLYAFVSHAWAIPFRTLVFSILKSCLTRWNSSITFFILYSQQANLVEEFGDRVFLWIDVFCKNQHLPSPALDEFYLAIETPQLVIAILYPAINPIAINRVWCLFELFTAIRLNIRLQIAAPDDSLYCKIVEIYLQEQYLQEEREREAQLASADSPSTVVANPTRPPYPPNTASQRADRFSILGTPKLIEYLQQVLTVDVERAQATVPDDIALILGLIRQHVGVNEMNQTIYKYLAEDIANQDYLKLGDFSPACFGEDTIVTLEGRGQVNISTVKVGDRVLMESDPDVKPSCPSESYGVVELVTCDVIESGVLEMCCTDEGVYMTPEHPIFSCRNNAKGTGEWVLPKQIYEVKRHPMRRVFNIELKKGNAVRLTGPNGHVLAITLGNDLGLFPETDEIFGWGWKTKTNPHRLKYL